MSFECGGPVNGCQATLGAAYKNPTGESSAAPVKTEDGSRLGNAKLSATLLTHQPEIQRLTDPHLKSVVDQAMPSIQSMLHIHQCINDNTELGQLNLHSMSDVDNLNPVHPAGSPQLEWIYPNSAWFMKGHDRRLCLGVKTLDHFFYSKTGVLSFQAIFFAEDSNESVRFQYQVQKASDGRWLLRNTPQYRSN